MRRQNPARGVDAVQVRHADVHHHHIRQQLFRHLRRFAPIGGLPHYGHVGLFLEQRAHTVADYCVVVS